MAISSPGIGSGLDVNAIVSQLVELEKKPLAKLQTAASSLQSKLSAFGQLKSQISNLLDQASKLALPGTWDAMKLSSSNNTAISGTATNAAAATSFSMNVSQLAQAQSVGTAAITTNSAVGGGTLTIDIGRWSGTGFDSTPGGPTFTPKSGQTSVNISVTGTDTLSQIAAKINGEDAGVTATVLKDASGERLLLRSSATGEEQGFRITAIDDDGNNTDNSGLSRLAFDPETGSFGAGLTQAAKNTLATINGVAVTSSNNQFTGVIDGVSLTVNETTNTAATITIAADKDQARTSLNNFVSSYNSLMQALTEMTKYNPSDKSAGTLQADSTAVGLQSALRRLMGSNGPTGNLFSRLSDVGLEIQTDGTLKVNESRLGSALENRADLKAFFSQDDSNTALDGLGIKIKDFATGLLAADGLFANKTKSIEDAKARNSKDQDRISDRVERTEARLLAQYSRLDTTLAKLNALNSYVAQQVTTWNSQKS